MAELATTSPTLPGVPPLPTTSPTLPGGGLDPETSTTSPTRLPGGVAPTSSFLTDEDGDPIVTSSSSSRISSLDDGVLPTTSPRPSLTTTPGVLPPTTARTTSRTSAVPAVGQETLGGPLTGGPAWITRTELAGNPYTTADPNRPAYSLPPASMASPGAQITPRPQSGAVTVKTSVVLVATVALLALSQS